MTTAQATKDTTNTIGILLSFPSNIRQSIMNKLGDGQYQMRTTNVLKGKGLSNSTSELESVPLPAGFKGAKKAVAVVSMTDTKGKTTYQVRQCMIVNANDSKKAAVAIVSINEKYIKGVIGSNGTYKISIIAKR